MFVGDVERSEEEEEEEEGSSALERVLEDVDVVV